MNKQKRLELEKKFLDIRKAYFHMSEELAITSYKSYAEQAKAIKELSDIGIYLNEALIKLNK